MKNLDFIFAIALSAGILVGTAAGQQPQTARTKPGSQSSADKASADKASADKATSGRAYSGMYTFLKEGEFLQLTVEDDGRINGFISRFGEGESDKGAFLDQFFKEGKLDGNKLSFTTEVVHGVSFEFKGTVERGEGKNPGDEAYFVLKGTLGESASDVNKRMTARSREVMFKMFPQEAAPAPVMRK